MGAKVRGGRTGEYNKSSVLEKLHGNKANVAHLPSRRDMVAAAMTGGDLLIEMRFRAAVIALLLTKDARNGW